MKKHVFLAFMAALLVVFSGCLKTIEEHNPAYEKITIETNSTDLKEISAAITEKYLKGFKKFGVAKKLKLKDYKIQQIDNIQGDDKSFEFWVTYSVKPSSGKTYWMAGNGRGEGPWIVNKVQYLVVEKVDKGYVIKDMGTGK
jgi:hypothetical protein